MKKQIFLLVKFALMSLFILGLTSCQKSEQKSELSAMVISDNIEKPIETVVANKNELNFRLGSQFNTIKKWELDMVRDFADLIGQEHANRILEYKTLNVILLENGEQTKKKLLGNSGSFTAEQLDFLQSLDYSSNVLVWAEYLGKNKETGKIEETHWTPYLSVVPEYQATYQAGEDALLTHLNGIDQRYVEILTGEEVKPGKISFTITNEGTLDNVRVMNSCGFPELDKKMIDRIKELPGKWQPATNVRGDEVAQTLILSYGNMGC